MGNREPLSYIISYGLDANIHELWDTHGVYTRAEEAYHHIEELLSQWRVKCEYVFPNGIIEIRIFEGGKGYFTTISDSTTFPSPTPAPSPTPTPTPVPTPAPAPSSSTSISPLSFFFFLPLYAFTASSAPPPVDAILMENGTGMLMEDSTFFLEENAPAPAPVPPPAPSPTPSPSPPAAAIAPSLDFSIATNSMYHPTL